jgi:hypothetical protein
VNAPILGLGAAALLVASLALLPFLPGDHDRLALPLATMMQFFALAGLVLVPFGALWLVFESRRGEVSRIRHGLALLSVGAATVVAAVVVLMAHFSVGPTLGLALAVLWIVAALRMVSRVRQAQSTSARVFDPTPFYFVVLPIVAAICHLAIVPRAEEFARNRAIDNSAPLIGDIERFHAVHGRYPTSMLSVWKDYRTGVIGVPQYHYEPAGESYNLWFEQFSHVLGTREFVVYNPRGEQQVSSHDSDRLRYTGPALELRRGYYAVRNASRPGWKRFLFD